MSPILFKSQRTFAFDSCLADNNERLLLIQEILENAAEPIFIAAFVDKGGLANVLGCSGGIATFQEVF